MTKLDFPDTPTTGQLFGSSGTVWRFDGTRWASTAGASGARGAVGYAQITAAQGSFSLAVVDITGLGVTFPTIAGRRYRITGDVWAYSAVAGDGGSLYIYVDGAQRQQSNVYFPLASSSLPVRTEVVITATATGSSFAKLLYGRSSGSGAHTVYASPTIPGFILVEDITYEAGSGGPVFDTAKAPLGMLSYNKGPTSVQGGIGSAVTQLAGMLVTGNLVTGRWYRVRTGLNVQKDGTGVAFVYLSIRDSPMTTVHAENLLSLEANEYGNMATDFTFKAVATGSVSFFTGLRINTGTVAYLGTAPWTGWISLEDLGAQL